MSHTSVCSVTNPGGEAPCGFARGRGALETVPVPNVGPGDCAPSPHPGLLVTSGSRWSPLMGATGTCPGPARPWQEGLLGQDCVEGVPTGQSPHSLPGPPASVSWHQHPRQDLWGPPRDRGLPASSRAPGPSRGADKPGAQKSFADGGRRGQSTRPSHPLTALGLVF